MNTTQELPERYKNADWDLIPDHMIDGLQMYVESGIEPGGFMTRLLENDFMGAARKADLINARSFYDYAKFFDSYLPRDCYGSAEIVDKWIKQGGLRGRK